MELIKSHFVKVDGSLERFIFYNDEKLPYSVLLPNGTTWHLSADVKYNLIQNESPLYSHTRKMMNDALMDQYDFSKSEFETGDILTFFYVVNFPLEAETMTSESLYNIVVLASLYAPRMVDRLLATLYRQCLFIKTSEVEPTLWWDLVELSQMVDTDAESFWINQHSALLSLYPYTLYKHNPNVKLDRLKVSESLKSLWRDRDVDALREIEEINKTIVEKNADGVELIRIPMVARSMGKNLSQAQSKQAGPFIAAVYRAKRFREPSKIGHLIDGIKMQINHYTLDDYDIVVAGINNYLKKHPM